jgi:16S rRNA (guanine(527)-N(7))-methyltransferase RsmG
MAAGQHSVVSRETRRAFVRRSSAVTRRPRDPESIGAEVSRIVQDETLALELDLTPAFFARIRTFAMFLAIWGEKMSLTSRPHDADDLAFHVIDSLMPVALAALGKLPNFSRALQPGMEVLDLGSGAGFPGLVLASASRAHFTLCEARRKRTTFLTVTAEELGLFDLTVKGHRVTPSTFSSAFDLVMTRALDGADDFHTIAKAALKRGGLAVLYVSPRQAADLTARRIAGFELAASAPYELTRDRETVPRAIVMWRKT